MKKWYYFLLLLLLIPIPGSAFAETIKVEIPSGASNISAKSHFLPEEVSVRPGDKVQWGNTDSDPHTVTSGALLSGVTGLFDSGTLNPGDRFEVLFGGADIGEIKYFCTLHPWMIGIVNVVDVDREFKIYHNVGSDISDSPIDIAYKVQRNLVDVKVNLSQNSITFSFAGKINNDKFEVRLPEELIRNPQSVWVGDTQTTKYESKSMDGITTMVIPLNEATEEVRVVGTQVIGKLVVKEQVLINQILSITDKKFYERGESIIVSGEIRNPVQLYQISLDILSPSDAGVYHQEIPLVNETRFTETIPTIGVLRELGEYTVKISAPSAKSSFNTFEYGIGPKEYSSPKKQMKSGISASEVGCNEGLNLLMKISNGKPVCLTDSSSEILLERGWAKYF
jgi:plastocyanin